MSRKQAARPSSGLTVGEVASAVGVAPSAVRYYERIGLLPEPPRVGGWRRYPLDVVERLHLVRLATGSGFSLAETRVLLDGLDDGAGVESLRELARAKLPELETALRRAQLLVAIMRAATECACPSLHECARRAEAAGVVTANPERPARQRGKIP